MRAGSKTQIYHDFARLFGRGSSPSRDRVLLDRFLNEGDESAFETLVDRHGPMVLGVCRRLLLSRHDADDAFQATFLVLVRKAGQLRDADHLGPWLYGVATRVATKARAQAARRRERLDASAVENCPSDELASEWLDVRSILDAELRRLPAKNREVLILCLLEGATAEEASRQLDCPLGTVKSRLARGREALRIRLTSRGIAPTVALTAVTSVVASPVSAALTRTTLGTIASLSAGGAPGLAALTRGVASAMFTKKTVLACLLLGGIALTGLGTATWNNLPAWAQPPGVANEPDPGAGQAEGRVLSAREQSKQNLKKILMAVHNAIIATNHVPAAAIYGSDGLPKLSWRVALLPYLGENALFEEFHQDEAWDSPHNKRLIDRMPAVFETPHLPAPMGQTRLRGFMGKGTMFDGVEGIGLAQVTDGTSYTVLLASAREATTWTKPGELSFVMGQPVSSLEVSDANQWLVGMVDGSAGDVSSQDVSLLMAMITRNGGEVEQPPFTPGAPTAPPQPHPQPTPPPFPAAAPNPVFPPNGMPGMVSGSPTPPTSPQEGVNVTSNKPIGMAPAPNSVEQRLQRLEDKLDRLIQRLDAQSSEREKP